MKYEPRKMIEAMFGEGAKHWPCDSVYDESDRDFPGKKVGGEVGTVEVDGERLASYQILWEVDDTEDCECVALLGMKVGAPGVYCGTHAETLSREPLERLDDVSCGLVVADEYTAAVDALLAGMVQS